MSFAFPFCFYARPLHPALLPERHGAEPLEAFVGTKCQSGRTSSVNDREVIADVSSGRTRDEVSLQGAGFRLSGD